MSHAGAQTTERGGAFPQRQIGAGPEGVEIQSPGTGILA